MRGGSTRIDTTARIRLHLALRPIAATPGDRTSGAASTPLPRKHPRRQQRPKITEHPQPRRIQHAPEQPDGQQSREPRGQAQGEIKPRGVRRPQRPQPLFREFIKAAKDIYREGAQPPLPLASA